MSTPKYFGISRHTVSTSKPATTGRQPSNVDKEYDLYQIINEASALGYINIGGSDLGNYSFNTTQSVGAGTDDYVLTYNNSNGLIELAPPAETSHLDGSNVLWVSKEGDNSTGEKGNMHKPYADPFTAAADMDSGDVMIIMPGTYTVGRTGSGADYITDDVANINLFRSVTTGATVHAMPGVTLQRVGLAYTGGPEGGFFSITNSGNYYITGHGRYIWGISNGLNQTFAVMHVDSPTANVYFEADYLSYSMFGVRLWEIGPITNIKIRHAQPAVSGTGAPIAFRERANQTGKSVYFQIDSYDNYNLPLGDSDFSGLVSFRVGGADVEFTDSSFDFKFGTVRKQDPLDLTNGATGGDFGFVFGMLHDTQFHNCSFNVEFDSIVYKDTGNGNTQGGDSTAYPNTSDTVFQNQPVISVGEALLDNTSVNIHVKSCISDFPCIAVHGQTTGTELNPGLVKVTGNFVSTESYCIVLDDLSSGTNANKRILFDGTFRSQTHSVIGDRREAGEDAQIIFSGRYETEAAGWEVAGITAQGDGKTQFINCTLINDGTTDAVDTNAGSAIDVLFINAWTNGTGTRTGTNITEAGDGLSADALVI